MLRSTPVSFGHYSIEHYCGHLDCSVAVVLALLIIPLLLAPYFIIILYLSPRTLASYVLLHAFKQKSEEVALELQEDLEYSDRMAERVMASLEANGKNSQINQIFDELDYNQVVMLSVVGALFVENDAMVAGRHCIS